MPVFDRLACKQWHMFHILEASKVTPKLWYQFTQS